MPEPVGSEARLQALRRRWEAEKSTAFLPLAEEYRRLGRLREAIEVLELGLKTNPGYTSGLVALGRCRLESGDSDGAASVLERVVAQDPEQLVASKLLIEAYLRTGRPREARSRLEIYSRLNTKDPEIGRLRDRLAALTAKLEAAVQAERIVAPDTAAGVSEPPPAPAEVEAVVETPGPAAAASPAPSVELESPLGEPSRARAQAIFVGLDGPAVVSRYLRGLAIEGIFPLAFPQPSARPARVLAAAPALAAPQPEAAKQAEPELPEPQVPVEPEFVPEPLQEAEPPSPIEPRTASPFEEEVERAVSGFIPISPARMEPVAEEVVAVEVDETPVDAPFTEPATPLEPPAAETSPALEAPALAAVEASPADAAPLAEATATLGDLYLQQGHAAEAERIFGAVLERDPANHGARRGLDEAQEVLRQPPAGLSLRRAGALRDYLTRLRGGAKHVS